MNLASEGAMAKTRGSQREGADYNFCWNCCAGSREQVAFVLQSGDTAACREGAGQGLPEDGEAQGCNGQEAPSRGCHLVSQAWTVGLCPAGLVGPRPCQLQ